MTNPTFDRLHEGKNDCAWPQQSITVKRVATAKLPTEIGDFTISGYQSTVSDEEFVVLYKGRMDPDRATLVRIHSQCLTGDVFGSVKCDCGPQLRRAMEMIEKAGHGAIVYQQQEGRGIGIINKIRAYHLQDQGADTVEANEQLGFVIDARDYQQCAEVLFDLGLCKVRVISNNPKKLAALEKAGLQIVERIPIEVVPEPAALHYLLTKKEKMGHLLNEV
jgi:3,4-dihydroxy 2-butanone 4-phosphate synthase/GTP cyclohydrolase II